MQEILRPDSAPAANTPFPRERTPLLDWEKSVKEPKQGAVIACIDRSSMDLPVVAHARELAHRLGSDLVFAQVLEPSVALEGPQDPLSWGIRRHKCRERFNWLAEQHGFERVPKQVLLEGRPAKQLADWAGSGASSILTLATHCEDWGAGTGLGSTAQKLLDRASASLLLVPPGASTSPEFDRIVVPLDGSCRADSVLPTVIAMAKVNGGEVIAVHVVPEPHLTEIGPLEPEAIRLRDEIIRRNEQVARTYIERVLRRLRAAGVDARAIINHGDPRERLQQVIIDQNADLLVTASHGQSGRSDVACGSVVYDLATHATRPMLILRQDEAAALRGMTGDAASRSAPLQAHQ